MIRLTAKQANRLLRKQGSKPKAKAHPSNRAKAQGKKVSSALGTAPKRSKLELRFERDLILTGLPMPLSEYRFWPDRKWRLDFYWPDYKLALEIDGGTRNHGQTRPDGSIAMSGHLTPDGFQRDCEKYNHAVMAGIFVLRADSDMVTGGSIFNHLQKALLSRGWEGFK